MFVVALLTGSGGAACTPSPASEVIIGRAGSPPPAPPTTAVEGSIAPVTFTVSSFDVEGPASPASVERVKAAVAAAFGRYLEAAVLIPVRSGGPAGELTPLFTARAAEHLSASADRNAFVDEGLPPASHIVALASGLRLVGLADGNGDVVLVAARMDLKVSAGIQETTIIIERGGDLLLVPDGDAWKIDSYRIRVTRDTPDWSHTVVAGQ